MESKFISSIPGIEFYPIIALVFVFSFFTALLVWFFMHDREKFSAYGLAPFDSEIHTLSPRRLDDAHTQPTNDHGQR